VHYLRSSTVSHRETGEGAVDEDEWCAIVGVTQAEGGPMPVDPALSQRFGLGPIDQISFAVADVDEAAPRYAAMFGGPFAVVEVPPMDITYRGRPSSVELKLAFGRTADIEVELVEVVAGDSPAADHLTAHGEGFFHVRFPVTDLLATQTAMEDEGFEVTFAGSAGALQFAYLVAPLLNNMTVELIQFPTG
jgi:hypothetical protein